MKIVSSDTLLLIYTNEYILGDNKILFDGLINVVKYLLNKQTFEDKPVDLPPVCLPFLFLTHLLFLIRSCSLFKVDLFKERKRET